MVSCLPTPQLGGKLRIGRATDTPPFDHYSDYTYGRGAREAGTCGNDNVTYTRHNGMVWVAPRDRSCVRQMWRPIFRFYCCNFCATMPCQKLRPSLARVQPTKTCLKHMATTLTCHRPASVTRHCCVAIIKRFSIDFFHLLETKGVPQRQNKKHNATGGAIIES